jgi:hypothetical protein
MNLPDGNASPLAAIIVHCRYIATYKYDPNKTQTRINKNIQKPVPVLHPAY